MKTSHPAQQHDSVDHLKQWKIQEVSIFLELLRQRINFIKTFRRLISFTLARCRDNREQASYVPGQSRSVETSALGGLAYSQLVRYTTVFE
jgi:hypothetical protein